MPYGAYGYGYYRLDCAPGTARWRVRDSALDRRADVPAVLISVLPKAGAHARQESAPTFGAM